MRCVWAQRRKKPTVLKSIKLAPCLSYCEAIYQVSVCHRAQYTVHLIHTCHRLALLKLLCAAFFAVCTHATFNIKITSSISIVFHVTTNSIYRKKPGNGGSNNGRTNNRMARFVFRTSKPRIVHIAKDLQSSLQDI